MGLDALADLLSVILVLCCCWLRFQLRTYFRFGVIAEPCIFYSFSDSRSSESIHLQYAVLFIPLLRVDSPSSESVATRTRIHAASGHRLVTRISRPEPVCRPLVSSLPHKNTNRFKRYESIQMLAVSFNLSLF